MYIKLLFWVNSIFFLKQARGYSIYHMYLFHTHTEKALEFLDHHLQHIIKSEKFCVTDANDFIKKFKKIKETWKNSRRGNLSHSRCCRTLSKY